MSSQSVNSTTYSGYTASIASSSVSGAGTLWMARIPSRDASDNTRLIREQLRYNEFKASNPISPGNTENPWIAYGNQFRLSYLYGKLKCTNVTCTANAFSGNGPYVDRVNAHAGNAPS